MRLVNAIARCNTFTKVWGFDSFFRLSSAANRQHSASPLFSNHIFSPQVLNSTAVNRRLLRSPLSRRYAWLMGSAKSGGVRIGPRCWKPTRKSFENGSERHKEQSPKDGGSWDAMVWATRPSVRRLPTHGKTSGYFRRTDQDLGNPKVRFPRLILPLVSPRRADMLLLCGAANRRANSIW